jgi:hypothetical protein
MKTLDELRAEQEAEVRNYRAVADHVVQDFVHPHEGIIGALLAGSVARGDARHGPFGLYIDLVLVAEHRENVDLTAIFGPSIEPFIPKHCVKVNGTGIALELTTRKDLEDIRSRWEPEIYARHESLVLYDRTGFLSKWKSNVFSISDEQKKDRALVWFFRCQYLVGDYRVEKWKHRSAWVQLCQIGNEAAECYCFFLYCINGQFIPRKDWVTYLTYELPDKATDHARLLETIYTSNPKEEEIDVRFKCLNEVLSWMNSYCHNRKWIS